MIDEMVDGSGGLRRAWRGVVEPVLTLGRGQLAQRGAALARAAVEADAGWRCDPVPLPLPLAEFRALADGLAQRASLLERVLADLYGPQDLLRAGLLPPAIVWGSRHFVRPARLADPPPGRRILHLYAADLVRGPDGAWRVLADRCGKPSGIAAVLENRRALRRVMPELFGAPVEGLNRFFEGWRDSLAASVGPDGAAVLLTDGRGSFGPHEPVLLARELGCHLVRGGDLTLRGGRVWMKTLRGLTRVDLLLNRQPAALLDPLELDWNNGAGAPGLLAVMRAGGIAVQNDPGAALGGDAAVAAMLPRLAPALLGEALRLPSVERVWLGEPDGRARVLADPEGWLFGSADNNTVPPLACAALGPRARGRLLDGIAASPGRFVATAPVARSVMPALVEGALEPRPVVLRLYLRADAAGWTALPGGLVRAGGATKDVFVIRDGDERLAAGEVASPTRARPPMPIRRDEADLPVRVAARFFALGDGVERFEAAVGIARALALRLVRFTDRPHELVELRILAEAVRPAELLPADTLIDPAAPGLRAALARLAEPAGALAIRTRRLADAIAAAGERMTGEMVAVLGEAAADARASFAAPGSLDGLLRVANRQLLLAAAVGGLAGGNMVRSGGWLFFDLALRLARIETVCGVLAACLGPASRLPRTRMSGAAADAPPDGDTALALLLELQQSALTYRSRYGFRLEPTTVLDLLLAEEGNPRGLAFQTASLRAAIARLGELGGAGLAEPLARIDGEAQAIVGRVVAAADPLREAGRVGDAAATIAREAVHLRGRLRRRFFDILPETRLVAS